jgi:YfiH family protein
MQKFFNFSSVNFKVFDKTDPRLSHVYSPEINFNDQNIILQSMQASKLALLTQEHGDKVFYVDQNYSRKIGDALVTDKPGLVLGIQTADCACVLLASVDQIALGAVHLGWRGAFSDLLANTLKMMRKLSTAEIVAFIGPCIRQNSYEVDERFRDNAIGIKPQSNNFFATINHELCFDLPGFVRYELNQSGVKQIQDQQQNTYDSDIHFSFRAAQHKSINEKRRILSCIVKT